MRSKGLELETMGERSEGYEPYPLSNIAKATNLVSILALGLAACSPREIRAMAAPEAEPVPATETIPPTPTEIQTPTETPDPLVEASQNLPKGSGTIEKQGDNWVFNSPEGMETGKNVLVKWGELTYEDGTTQEGIVLVEHPKWPLFLENGQGNLETALEYVDIKKPFVDEEGNSIPITCEFYSPGQIESGRYFLGCFFVANGPSFRVGEVEYQPVAIPMEGNPDNPMLTNGALPFLDGTRRGLWEYPNRVFVPKENTVIPLSHAFFGERIINSLDQGEVFWTLIYYDRQNIDEFIENARTNGWDLAVYTNEKVKEHSQKTREAYTLLSQNKFGKIMQQRQELWSPSIFITGN